MYKVTLFFILAEIEFSIKYTKCLIFINHYKIKYINNVYLSIFYYIIPALK